MRIGPPLLACLLAAAAGPVPAQPRAGGCEAPARPDRIAEVTEHGEFRLASGALVRLDGVRLAVEGAPGAGARRLLADLVGQEVAAALREGADRWGRRSGEIRLADGASAQAPADLATLLLASGLALVDAGPAPGLCRPELLSVEAQARAARRGLWADAPPLLPAADVERLNARAGAFTLVEGRVRAVGERRTRTYLDFGPFGEGGFTVVLPARTWARLKAGGYDAASLKGRRIRVRGIIETRRGPTVEVTAADAVEVLESRRLRP